MAMNHSTKLKYMSVSALGFALVLFFTINILSRNLFKSIRFDLTENNLYTLSDGTKNILANIKEPIRLNLYFSKKLADGAGNILSYADRVTELLEEYQRLSNGQLELNIIDPEPFSEAEDIAIGYGLHGLPVDESGSNFYFGLVGTNSIDNEKVIPFFQQSKESQLEYDITQLVYELGLTDKPTLGLITEIPLAGDNRNPYFNQNSKPWTVYSQWEALYNIKQLNTEITSIPSDIKLIALVNPQHLNDQALYAIDQYVVNGGHLIAFLDSYAELNNKTKTISPEHGKKLNNLLKQWGVHFHADKVIADKGGAKEVWFNQNGRQTLVRYPLWQDVAGTQINQDDFITNNIENITLASPGYFTKTGNVPHKITTLLHSSTNSMLISPEQVANFTEHPEELNQQFKATKTDYIQAVRISGNIQSAYKKAPDTTSEITYQKHKNQSDKNANIVLISDSDFLNERFWLQEQSLLGQSITIPMAGNGQFALNAIDNLSGSNELISVRSRGEFTRPFTYLQKIKNTAEEKFRAQETALLKELKATEEKLSNLNDHKVNGDKLLLSQAQQETIENFRDEQVKIRKALRKVKHNLQQDLDSLTNKIKYTNIALMPLLVGMTGLGCNFYRRHKSKKHQKKG